MAISKALRDIYMVNPSGAYYMEAVSISHPAMTKDLHLTNASINFDANIENGKSVRMISLPFSVKLPDKDTSGSQALTLTFSNVEQELIWDIETMARQPYNPAVLMYRVYVSNNVDAAGNHIQMMNPAWRYDISNFTVNQNAITAVASKVNMHNRVWPKLLYNATRFPGLDR